MKKITDFVNNASIYSNFDFKPYWFEKRYSHLEMRLLVERDSLVLPSKLQGTGTTGRVSYNFFDSSCTPVQPAIFKRGPTLDDYLHFHSIAHASKTMLSRNAEIIDGKCIYLGWFFSHYGHALLESLSRYWPIITGGLDPSELTFVYHSHRETYKFEPTLSVTRMLDLLGINSANTLFVSEPLIFREIYVPEQSLILRRSLTGFQRETWWALSKMVDVSPGKEKVYISRAKLGVSDREMENELQLEGFLEARGFTIVYPEESVFDDQINIFRNADIVVGPGGSGLHNSIFMKDNSVLLIINPSNFCPYGDTVYTPANVKVVYYVVETDSNKYSVDFDELDLVISQIENL